jgi:type II secretory pathway component GspD/PulD (secretin)
MEWTTGKSTNEICPYAFEKRGIMTTKSCFLLLTLLLFVRVGSVCAETSSASWSSGFVLPQYSQTISLDFKDADLKDIMKMISRQIGINFVFESGIKVDPITVFMENVPVEEALDMILSSNKLTYVFVPETNIVRIKTIEDTQQVRETRVYQLHYSTVQSSAVGGTLESGSAGGDSGGGSSGGGGASSGGGSSESDASSLGDIKGAILALVGDDGMVVEDPRTNSLVVSSPVRFFPEVEKLIALMDVPVPQIVIDLEMLDVGKSDVDNLGVKFGGAMASVTASGAIPSNENTGYERYKDILRFYEEGNMTSSLNAAINFLRTRTGSRSLARPRIMTLNNQKAEIRLQAEEVVGEKRVLGTDGAPDTFEAERMPTGIILTVTPQANIATGEILLALSPKVIEARQGLTFENRSYKNPEERGIDAYLKVKSGHTIVIAGLLRSEKTNAVTKLPFLGDIPFLGMAFRYKESSVNERELITIVTPSILGMGELPQAEHTPTSSTYFNPPQADVDGKLRITGEQNR